MAESTSALVSYGTRACESTTEAPVTCPCFLLRFRLCFQDPAKNHNIVNSLFKAAVYVGGIGTHTSTQLTLKSETLTLWSLWWGCSAENLILSEFRTTRPCCTSPTSSALDLPSLPLRNSSVANTAAHRTRHTY